MTRKEKRNELQRRREVRLAARLLENVERKNKTTFTEEILNATEIYFSKEEGKKEAIILVRVPNGFYMCRYKIMFRYLVKFVSCGLIPSSSKTFFDYVHENKDQFKMFLKGLDNGDIKKIF